MTDDLLSLLEARLDKMLAEQCRLLEENRRLRHQLDAVASAAVAAPVLSSHGASRPGSLSADSEPLQLHLITASDSLPDEATAVAKPQGAPAPELSAGAAGQGSHFHKGIKNVSMNETAAADGAAASARKSKNRSANRAALELLSQHYPEVFDRNNVRPLKIGIQEDLLADGKVSKGKIKRALASWVRGIQYYKSLQEGAVRIDLAGQPAGEVTADEAEHARGLVKKWRKERQEREKQQRKVQREQERQGRMQDKLSQLVSRHNNG